MMEIDLQNRLSLIKVLAHQAAIWCVMKQDLFHNGTFWAIYSVIGIYILRLMVPFLKHIYTGAFGVKVKVAHFLQSV